MQILSTMANAQATQAQATLQSVTENAQAPSVPIVVSEVIAAASSQICLTSFDPDDTPFTIAEWKDYVTRIQRELGISVTLIVLKTGLR